MGDVVTSTVLSVVIPAFNAQGWITRCLNHLLTSLKRAEGVRFEIIVVDDGSTDDTAAEARGFSGAPVTVLTQPNQGRFLARLNGLKHCQGTHVLFLDTRVFMHVDSIRFVAPYLDAESTSVWTADVQANTSGNNIARFWRAIETVFWRRYMLNRSTTSFGVDDFDFYPKGTTALIIPRDLAHEAMTTFVPSVGDWRKVNDDTALLRHVAERTRIHISPGYTCTYNARTTLRAFVRHANHRGSVLIDGYLRPGTRLNIPIRMVMFLAPLGLFTFALVPALLVSAIIAVPLVVGALALAFGARPADVAVLTTLFWPFAGSYLAGMYWGLWLRIRSARSSI